MSAPTIPTCPLGLTADDLSAWRDHALSVADEQRITSHTRGCPACQRTIAAHAALAAALQADQPPAPDPRNWSRLHARINGERLARTPSAPTARRTPRRAIWGGLGAAAAVLLISALFISLFEQQAQRRGATSQRKAVVAATPPALTAVPPTAPIAGPALGWQTHLAPASVIPPPGNQFYDNGFAFSPTDAKTAYICATTNAINAPIAIWATHDGAATWTHVSDLPYISEIAECNVSVDAADPLRLNVIVSEQSVPSYLSDDGGKTWRTLSDDMQLVGLDTRSGVSVAITTPWDFARPGPINPSAPQRQPQLSVSRDDWRTWQPINGALAAQGMIVEKAWRRPGDGALLVEAATRVASVTPTGASSTGAPPFAVYTYSLWQSADLGASWSRVPTPANFGDAYDYVVAQPLSSDPWRVCGFQRVGSGATQSGLIGCTSDGGQTWTARPLPALKEPCGAGCLKQQETLGAGGSALLSDGSLVTIFYAGPQRADVIENLSMFHIFRLAPEASQWQDLGSQPGNALLLIGAPPTGTLVGYSGGGSLDGLGGEIVGQMGGYIPNRGALAIATLP